MNQVTRLIHNIIYKVSTECNGKEQWVKHRHRIRLALKKLEPDKPEDETSGFLAYNVGHGKPRMKIKIGRFFTKKLQLNNGYLSDVAIQKIATMVSIKLWPNISTELVYGVKITEAYRQEVGTSSCMTGSSAVYTRLYESNPDRFQMLIMRYGNNSARAIVHKLDNGEYLLDRVYSDSEDLKTKMQDYAIIHKWLYGYGVIYFNGSRINDYSKIIVSGLYYEDGEVPYMDTLTEYRFNDNKIDIFHLNANYSADGELKSTCGCLEGDSFCDTCGIRLSDDDIYSTDDYVLCYDCYYENYFYCQKCGENCHSDDRVCIQDEDIDVCCDCADNCYYQCEHCNSYYSSEGMYNTHYNECICEGCLDEDYICCEGCGEYFTPSDINNHGLCKDCRDSDIPIQNENDTEKLPFEKSIENVE